MSVIIELYEPEAYLTLSETSSTFQIQASYKHLSKMSYLEIHHSN